MILNVGLTLNLDIEIDEDMVDELGVDGYDLALMIANMYGEDLVKSKCDDDSYRSRINIKSWKIN